MKNIKEFIKNSGTDTNGFLGGAVSDWWKMVRLILLLMVFLGGIILLFEFFYYKMNPRKLGISMINSSSISLIFESQNSNLEMLQLPAHQFWIESELQLSGHREINIRATGLVSIRCANYYDFKQFEKSDKTYSYVDFVLEYERYYRTRWYNPDGVPIMRFDPIEKKTADEQMMDRKSDNLKILRESEYGSLLCFVISNSMEEIIKNLSLPERIKYIDSLLVFDHSTNVVKFFIGSSADITANDSDYIITPKRIPSSEYKESYSLSKARFSKSHLYFCVNDAIIKNESDFYLTDIDRSKYENRKLYSIRKKHQELYHKYSRKHSLWYLDNAGTFNILILSNKESVNKKKQRWFQFNQNKNPSIYWGFK